MHFSVPETKETKEPNGSQTYIAYYVYINGILHCIVRYSQLHTLHEQLKQVFGPHGVPPFPPKKLFPLSAAQLEERRYGLEKYLQKVGQNSELVNCPILRRFLLLAQQKSFATWHDEEKIAVWLPNSSQVTVCTEPGDSSDHILQKVCENLRISDELQRYFSLFIQRLTDGSNGVLTYLLQDIDNPLITLKNAPAQNRIMLRKNYWDPAYDMKLISDRSALNVLYTQIVADVGKGWIVMDDSIKKQLEELQARGSKREYLEIARSLRYYGYLKFDGCTCDYPELGTEVMLFIGYKEIVAAVKADNSETETGTEYCFKIVRIRSWRVTQLTELNNQVQLSFEYLLAKDKLQWITIISEYAFLISVCLQSIVDELMIKRSGILTTNKKNEPEMTRINSNGHITQSGSSLKNLSKDRRKSSSSIAKLSEKLTVMNLSSSSKNPYTVSFLSNDSFENIGDEDL